MPHHSLRFATVLLAVAGLLLVLVPPVQAEVWRYEDETAPRRTFGDIDSVRVDARERFVFVRVAMHGTFPEELVVFLDVDGDRRPEFSGSYTGQGRMSVYRNDRWVGTSNRLRCRPASTSRDGDVLRVGFSRRCLRLGGDLPTRLRASVASNYETSGSTYDHAPAERRFGRWFRVG